MNVALNGKYYGIAQMRDNYYNEYLEVIEFNKNFGDISWGQKMYNYVNELSALPVCKCGNALKFLKFGRGYYSYCSNECRYKDEELKLRKKQTNLNKYGVENPMQSELIQNKRKKIFREEYGVDHQSQLDFVKEKKEQTYIERFGAVTNLLCKETKDKIKETNLKKFGVEHNSQSIEIKEKKKQTNQKNCGQDYNFQSDEFKSKSEISTLLKYGVKHTSLSKEIRKKQRDRKRSNKIIEIANGININPDNISFVDDILTINNYCERHNSFEISINLLHQRRFKYDNKICTKCYPVQKQSSGSEIEVKLFIESLGFSAKSDKKVLDDRHELDILISEKKFAVEYDGIYWHSDIHKSTNYHLAKTEQCEKQGIQLLHIFEDEWHNKCEIVKSIIKSKLGVVNNRMFARKCVINEIDSKTSQEFLNANHIQGNINSKIRIGLFYNNELVSLMTFGKKRLAMGNKTNVDGEYEMHRFCNKLNTSIIGGASKLLSYFIKMYRPVSILTFADRRYSQGNLYKQMGFSFIENTKPNYWYFEKNEMIRHHRFGYRKDVLVREGYDPNKTEHQIMSERGFLCIYDCGNMKFELNLIDNGKF